MKAPEIATTDSTNAVRVPKAEPTLNEQVTYLLKLMSKVAELLEEQIEQQKEILDKLQDRDLLDRTVATRDGIYLEDE